MTKEMFEWITKWQRETFPSATAITAAAHLNEEVQELQTDLILFSDQAVMEYADCFLLLFGSASLHGLSYDDICNAINKKMEVNTQREWGKVNEQGYVKHVSNSEPDDAVSDTTKMSKERDDGKSKQFPNIPLRIVEGL